MLLKKCFMGLVLAGMLIPVGVWADGMIVIPEPPTPDPFPLEVEYHHVDVSIVGNVAQTDIDQVFYNPTKHEMEGTYLFPIPDDAAISDFSMYVGGEEIAGSVQGADEARQIYEDYVLQQQDPALLEYVGQDLFQARVYPIEAKSEKRMKLGYTQELEGQSGIYSYTYPLNTEKFSATDLDNVRVSVELETILPLMSVYSPTHEIMIERTDSTHAMITYEEDNVLPDADFVLYYTTSDEAFGAHVLTYNDGDENFFMLLMAPDFADQGSDYVEKDIVFVLDTSGSMGEDGKLDQAKAALDFCIRHLNEGDRFDVIGYADTVHTSLVSGVPLLSVNDKTKKTARAQVKELTDGGGTNIYEALEAGLVALENGTTEDDGRLKIIVFLTDGLPTVGTTDIDNILENTAEKNDVNARIFAFGVGYDVNTNLLDPLSRQNKAISEYVLPNESIETKVAAFYGKIDNPVLSDVDITFDEELGISALYPTDYPDFFQGSQLVLIGKYDSQRQGTVMLTGKVGAAEERFAYRLDFGAPSKRHHFIARLWATRRIGALMDQIRLDGESDELVDEIVSLSKQYGIISQYTSFLVDLDISQGADELLEQSRGLWDDNAAEYELDSESGAKAVNNAQGTQDMFRQFVAEAPSEIAAEDEQLDKIRQRNDKTFYLQDGVWVDGEYEEREVIKIKQYSQGYFDLAAVDSELADYFALGDDVAVNFGGKNYLVSDEGSEEISSTELPAPTEGSVTDVTALAIGSLVVALILGVIVGLVFRKEREQEIPPQAKHDNRTDSPAKKD